MCLFFLFEMMLIHPNKYLWCFDSVHCNVLGMLGHCFLWRGLLWSRTGELQFILSGPVPGDLLNPPQHNEGFDIFSIFSEKEPGSEQLNSSPELTFIRKSRM